MSDRFFAALMLVFSLYYGFEAFALKVPFAYDSLGPKAFPILLAGLLVVFSLFILFGSESQEVDWPRGWLLFKSILVIATLVGYGLTLFRLGFIISTILMVTLLGRLFGATWLQSGVGGIVLGLLFYTLFAWILQLPLPTFSVISYQLSVISN